MGKIQYNRASQGNSGISSYAFCLRDELGDLIFAKGSTIDDTTNVEVEVTTILHAPIHCKQSQFNKVIIQTDSLIMQKILSRK